MQDESMEPQPQHALLESASPRAVRSAPGEGSQVNNAVEEDAVNGGHPISQERPVALQSDAIDTLAEENVASLFFDPSFSVPDSSLDFEWLFDNILTDVNYAADKSLTAMVSPQSSIAASTISPPSVPAQTSRNCTHLSCDSSLAVTWTVVQARLLDTLHTFPPEILMSTFFYPSNLAQFYELYFENYHPHFPILHKPTLDPTTAPPLLVTAIVTLGSTLSTDAAHFQIAIKIHDSLRYLTFNVRAPIPSDEEPMFSDYR